MTARDGGPAYPGKRCESVQPSDKFSPSTAEVTYGGLTVRQAYKIAALQGIMSNTDSTGTSEPLLSWLSTTSKNNPQSAKFVWLAELCAKAADAMLAEDAEFEARK